MRNPIPSFFIVHPSLTFGRRPSFFIFHCSLFIILSFFIAGCTKSTSPKTGSLSGRVILINDTGDPTLDPVDFSGVTVALYNLAALDTTIVRINQEYPQIGVHISQETEFDHRLQNPVSLATTDADGDFELDKISPGTYNLAVMKGGWGTVYRHSVSLNDGENILSNGLIDQDKATIILHPAVLMPPVVQTSMTFLGGHTYHFLNDTIITGDAIVESGAILAISPGHKVDFHGDFQTNSDSGFWRITSLHGMSEPTRLASVSAYGQVTLSTPKDSISLSNLIMEFSTEGLWLNGTLVSIENSVFRRSGSVALLLLGGGTSISNLLFAFNLNAGAYTVSGMPTIHTSVFHENGEGIRFLSSSGFVQSNYFSGNQIAVRPVLSSCEIKHNCFDTNDIAVSQSAGNPVISNNNFHDNRIDIELNAMYDTGLHHCVPQIQSNNFFGSGFYVHGKGSNSYSAGAHYAAWAINQDYICPDNYLSQVDIFNHVYDMHYPGVTGYHCQLIFSPRRLTPLASSGIL